MIKELEDAIKIVRELSEEQQVVAAKAIELIVAQGDDTRE